jgi:hypothetical protein
MAVSTCMKCSGHSFELALFTALGEGKSSRWFSARLAERGPVSWTRQRGLRWKP